MDFATWWQTFQARLGVETGARDFPGFVVAWTFLQEEACRAWDQWSAREQAQYEIVAEQAHAQLERARSQHEDGFVAGVLAGLAEQVALLEQLPLTADKRAETAQQVREAAAIQLLTTSRSDEIIAGAVALSVVHIQQLRRRQS
jgi:hypothetical protein